jgi:hypothetical protein
LLDTGHVLANLELSAAALNLPFEMTFDFDDREVNRLLGLDENREVGLALCQLGQTSSAREPLKNADLEDLPENIKQASMVSPREFQPPEIYAIHKAGYDISPPRGEISMCLQLGKETKSQVSIPGEPTPVESLPYPDAVFHRKSSRNFIPRTLSAADFASLLRVLRHLNGYEKDPYLQGICSGFLANGVESIENGVYRIDDKTGGIGLVEAGEYTTEMSPHLSQSRVDGECLSSLFVHEQHGSNAEIMGRQRVSICHDGRRNFRGAPLPGRFCAGAWLLRHRRIL